MRKQTPQIKKLKREDFVKIDLDKDKRKYYYSLKTNNLEICLEPCTMGFDVAAYRSMGLLEPKRCTHSNYGTEEEDAWNKALEIANDLYNRLG